MSDDTMPLDDGWTKIPNALLEHMGELGNAELRVLLALLRKTAGHQKERDRVSVSQIADMTGLTSRNAQNAITQLLKDGFIEREQVGKQGYAYMVKPYPVGTRITEDANHIPSDTISLGDTEPYPVGTRIDAKPYPLGTTQKKDLKKEEKIVAASADAPTAQPEKKKRPAKTEPQSPIEVRRAIAKGSQIDLDSGLQKDIIQVNQVAATIWNKLRTPDQALDSVLSDIRACGKWVRNSQHPYKGSDQCMPPSALVRFWPAWKESAKPKTPYLNGHTNGTQAPHDYSQDVSPYSDEYRAQLRAGRVR